MVQNYAKMVEHYEQVLSAKDNEIARARESNKNLEYLLQRVVATKDKNVKPSTRESCIQTVIDQEFLQNADR